MISLRSVMHAALLAVVSSASAQQGTSQPLASDQEARIFLKFHSGSPIRELRFAQMSDPLQAAREEIFLESRLADRALKSGLTREWTIPETIKQRADAAILDTWLRSQVADESVTTAQLEAYYREHLDEFRKPESATFHHLFLLVPPSDLEAERRKGEEAARLFEKTRQGADFGQLIAENSELEGAKVDGGKVGPVETSKLNQALRDVVQSLQPGELSKPVRTPYGWELVRLDEKTSSSVIPFEDVKEKIREVLVLEEVRKIQESATKRLKDKYPVRVHEEALAGEDSLSTQAVLLTVGDRELTVDDVLKGIRIMEDYGHVANPRERIRSALPGVTLTEQIKLAARDAGLLESSDLKARLRFSRNRILAGEYHSRHLSKRTPTEQDLRAEYEAEKETFRKPPQAKGILYRWDMTTGTESAASPGEQAFQRKLLLQRVTDLLSDAREGRITRQELATNADETTSLDWFREGPMGYQHDTAWFKTEPGNFTEPYFPRNNVLFVGWVEEIKKPEQIPFEEAREQIRLRLITRWTREEQKQMVQDIMKEMPKS